MSEANQPPLDSDDLQGTASEFLEFCEEERDRRRDSGAAFDEELYQEAVDMVLRRLRNLEQGGAL
jgi:hypothetical protein